MLAVFIVAPSYLLHRFALSAHHVRALAPFLCLTTAQTLHRLLVLKENQPLLDLPARFHPAIPGSSFVGVNSIGASSASHLLSADIMHYTELSTAELLSLLPSP